MTGQYLPLLKNISTEEFSFFDAKKEFLDSTTPGALSLAQLYLGGGVVPNISFYDDLTEIPASGEISFRDFYKQSPTYTISSNYNPVKEIQDLVITLTSQIPDGSVIPYVITGITADDIEIGSLTGNFVMSGGTANINIRFRIDNIAENELLTISITTLDNNIETYTVAVEDSISFLNREYAQQSVTTLAPDEYKIVGWKIVTKQARLGTTNIGGWPAPADPTPYPSGAGGRVSSGDAAIQPDMNFYYNLLQPTDNIGGAPAGRTCIRLYNTGRVSVGGAVGHGPWVEYEEFLPISAGSQVSFEWRAAGGGDAYDVFAYLLREDGYHQLLLNETQGGTSGDSGWVRVTKTCEQSGKYKFVFVSGTFDYSFGKVVGASLYVTKIEVTEP